MAVFSLGKIMIAYGVDLSQLKSGTAQANKSLASTGKASKGLGSTLMGLKVLVAGVAAGAFAQFAKSAISAASEAEEVRNLFEVSFGDMTEAADKWAAETSVALGVNDTTLQRMSGTIVNMTKAMGFSEEGAFSMAKGLSQMALDAASFYNLPAEAAFNKIRSGITGEAEGLKALGIVVNENTINDTEYARAILATGRQLTNQEKVQARTIVIMESMKSAQGDLIRTQDSWANVTRTLGEKFTDFMEIIGAELIPQLMPLLQIIGQKLPAAASFTLAAFNLLKVGFSNAMIPMKIMIAIFSWIVKNAQAIAGAVIGMLPPAFIKAIETTASTLGWFAGHIVESVASGELLGETVGGVVSSTLTSFGEIVDDIDKGLGQWNQTAAETIDTSIAVNGLTQDLTGSMAGATSEIAKNEASIKTLNEAYKLFGLETAAQSAATLEQAQAAHQVLIDGGLFTTEQLALIWANYEENRKTNASALTALQVAEAQKITDAFAMFGQTSRADEQLTHDQRVTNHEILIASGEFTTEELATMWSEYETVRGQQLSVAQQTAAKAATHMSEVFKRHGLVTRADSAQTLAQLKSDYEEIKNSGEANELELQEIRKKIREEEQKDNETSAQIKLDLNAMIMSVLEGGLTNLFTKDKAFAIASATVAAYLGAAKTMSLAPWPINFALAAKALAVGLAQVAGIKGVSLRKGTAGLDFQSFGRETPAMLHGSEAVIPQGSGNALANEIAVGLTNIGDEPSEGGDTEEAIQVTLNLDGETLAKWFEKSSKNGRVRTHNLGVRDY